MPYKFTYLVNQPILDASTDMRFEGNINGPSLIRVPNWVQNKLGRYYLYFAHHEGKTIRLAYADALTGPWTVYWPGALSLAESGFPVDPPEEADLHPEAAAQIASGGDGFYPISLRRTWLLMRSGGNCACIPRPLGRWPPADASGCFKRWLDLGNRS